MKQAGMDCLFPIWKQDTKWLVKDFIDKGFKTCICCINDGYLDESWCGRLIDENFVKELPPAVDPCGENGEFHSFCFEGPIYKSPVSIIAGEKTYKALVVNTKEQHTRIKDAGTKGFWFCDLLMQGRHERKNISNYNGGIRSS